MKEDLVAVSVTRSDGGVQMTEEFKDSREATYRYTIGRGGTLVILESRELPSLQKAEVHRAFAAHAWDMVEGLAFGDTVRPDVPSEGGEVWT